MFKKSAWMNKGDIRRAVQKLEEVAANQNREYTKLQIDGANEGLACLRDATPEYLINLIPQNHPDRIMAMQLLGDA